MVRLLVLCTGNSARSILAEALFNALGRGRVEAVSAGSHPKSAPHPLALATLERHGLPTAGLASKGFEAFAGADAPPLHAVVTVCDAAAAEACPVWPGAPVTAHWGLPDPAAAPEAEAPAAFEATYQALRARIGAFLDALDAESAEADPAALKTALAVGGGVR